MKVDPAIIAALCRAYGPGLQIPVGCDVDGSGRKLDGALLLWAISGAESNFGNHCPPRHEQSYCYGAPNCDAGYSQEYGCLAHCSFGPWQVMAVNARPFTPLEMLADPEKCISAAVSHLNRAVFPQKPKDLIQIAHAYNAGSFQRPPSPATLKYMQNVLRSYDVAMPAPEKPAQVEDDGA